MIQAFIPKEDPRLPDHYGIEVSYIDGHTTAFEIASHRLGPQILEFVTKDDFWNWVPIAAIKRIEFDKRFSTIIALKAKKDAEDKSKVVGVVADPVGKP